jgi:PIN domain nuclease of toxin-antitoxin system
MRLSLDTHIALWALVDSPKLSRRSRALIEDANNVIVISTVVLWEIAIKHGLNRGDANDMPLDAQTAYALFQRAGYQELTIAWRDAALGMATLPAVHADPFDRMLIAQTIESDVWLLTSDATVIRYGGKVFAN